MLSSTQVDAFRQEGFLAVPGLLPAPVVEECRRRSDTCMEDPQSGAIFRFGAGGQRIHCKIPQLAERDSLFSTVAQNPAVAGIVEALLGPARIFRDVVIGKPPVAGAVVHYHQDAAYWDVEPPDLALSAWIALDDAPREAGCLQVVPGSHRAARDHTLLVRGRRLPERLTQFLRKATSLTGTGDNPKTRRERTFAAAKKFALGGVTRFVPALNDLNDLRIDPGNLAPESLVSLPATAGDVIFFSSWLIHGTCAAPTSSPTWATPAGFPAARFPSFSRPGRYNPAP